MARFMIRVLRVVALIGFGLSAGSLVLLLIRGFWQAFTFPGRSALSEPFPHHVYVVTSALLEAGAQLFLSGILFVVCEIALRQVPRTTTGGED
jgi:hypothetical protein